MNKLNPQIESIFSSRLKTIDDGSFTMLGTPYELIAMLQNAFVEETQRIADTTAPNLLLNEVVNAFFLPPNQIIIGRRSYEQNHL